MAIIIRAILVVFIVVLRDCNVVIASCFLLLRFNSLGVVEFFSEILFAFLFEVIPYWLRILSVPDRNLTLRATSCKYPRFVLVELERVEFALFTVKFTNR